MSLVKLRDALLSITPNVHHYEAHKAKGNYIVWAEDGQGSAGYADNRMILQGIQGTIDYFTNDEFDPVFDQIQAALNALGMSWRLNSIQYEKDTGYIHYEWVWEMVSNVG